MFIPLPTFIAVLQTKVIETITEGRTLFYRSDTVIRGLVGESSLFQQYTIIVEIASNVYVVTVFWGDEGIDDVLKSGGIRIVGCGGLASFGVLRKLASVATCSNPYQEHTKPKVPKPPHCSVLSPAQA